MRQVFLLAVCFFFLGASGYAQQFRGLGVVTCEATASPAQVGTVGTTDTLGDIVLTCKNVPPPTGFAAAVSELTINVSVSTGPANANTIDLSSGSPVTDAVLTVNENECASASAAGSTFGNCGAPDERFQDPQFGVLTSSNRIEWANVRFPVPGATAGGPVLGYDCSDGTCFPEKTVLRLSGIRSLIDFTMISAFISIQSGTTIPVTNNVVNVGESSGPKPAYGNPPPSETGTVTCNSHANPAIVNPAGLAERVGPILLDCTVQPPPGGTVSTAPLLFDLGVRTNAGFSGATSPGPGGTMLSSATLTIDGDTAGTYTAELEAQNEIIFRGVSAPVANGSFQIAIDDMFADVAQLGVPNTATFPSTQVTAFVSIGGGQLPLTVNVLNVGVPVGPSPAATHDLPVPLSCTATAVPPVVRAEGIAGVQGDIVFACYLAPSDYAASFKADISVSLNVNVTNNVGFAGGDLTDAVLVVNENNCTAPASVGSAHGTCGGPFASFQDPQYGRLVAPNRLLWEDVEVLVPGVDPDANGPTPANPSVTTVRITGIRGYNAQLGIPNISTFPSTQVTAFIGIGKTSSLTINNNVLNVGVPIRGMISILETNPLQGRGCVGGGGQATLRVQENHANPLKIQGDPTFSPGNAATESGYFAPGSNNGGGASQSTRILFQFADVPRGVVVQAPKRVDIGDPSLNGDGIELRLLEGTDERGAGGALTMGEGLQAVAIDNGTGIAVYEVVDADTFRTEQIDVPFQVSWPGKSGGLLTRAGQATVRALLAPLSDVTVASGPEPEPRFLDPGDPGEVFLSLDGAGCFPGAYLGAFTDGLWFRDRNGDGAFDPSTEISGWGSPGDIPVDGDWNGDGFRDLGVFSGGTWFIDVNGDGAFDPTAEIKGWGVAGWTPVTGDWNGDGVTDLGAIEPSTMAWFRDLNGDFVFDPATEIVGWGSPGDTPVVGDWNGDGADDLGVFSGGLWFLDLDASGSFEPATEVVGWGVAGWTPIVGDWDGDGDDDLGAIDPATMAWFRDVNGDFLFDPATELVGWGSPGATPVTGDWNSDGADEIGVFSDGTWFLDVNGDSVFDPATEIRGWGAAGWAPVAGTWQ